MARRKQRESCTDTRLYKASNYSEMRAVYSVCTEKGKDWLLQHSMFQNGQPSPAGTTCQIGGGKNHYTFAATVLCPLPAKVPLLIPKGQTFGIAKFK